MNIKSGIDLVEVNRLKHAYKNFGERFLKRIYDPIEIEQKTNSFFNKGTQFLLGANLVVLVLIYFVIF